MANILNNVLTNPPSNKPAPQVPTPAFVIDTKGKVKPLEDKATLLPSRIFGSPIQYAKDIKQDILNIGKAAKGEANDHELGRINDLALKGGALALATYLCVKNPLKLNKAMEFAGVGTFLASMALWPKLAIQAPIKARTGVDIHRKYVDSQGRKKMLHQDPQYDLTDLYSREDLDKMGKKLKVSENLPDRDRFIKQRAKKTAVQGNTLWMMTAGIATPIMSALGSNVLEKPLGDIIEKVSLKNTDKALGRSLTSSDSAISKQSLEKLNQFLEANKDKALTPEMASDIAGIFGKEVEGATHIQTVISNQLNKLSGSKAKIDKASIERAWRNCFGDKPMPELPNIEELLNQEGGKDKVMQALGLASVQIPESGITPAIKVVQKTNIDLLNKQTLEPSIPTVGSLKGDITSIGNDIFGSFKQKSKAVANFIQARTGKDAGSHLARQMDKVSGRFLKSLHLSSKELKQLRDTDDISSLIESKLNALAGDKTAYERAIQKLSKLVDRFEDTVGSSFTDRLGESAEQAATGLKEEMRQAYVEGVARNAHERVLGEKSTFYRLLQTLDVFKRANDGQLAQQLETALGRKPEKDLVAICKKIMLKATKTDHIEKFMDREFAELTVDEYKAVMGVLYNTASSEGTVSALSGKAKTGLPNYIAQVKDKIVNWKNTMTQEKSLRILEDGVEQSSATERELLSGKPITDLIKEGANKLYNSQKWLKIFGGTMIALTGITLIATLLIGKKGKTEKQVEQESKQVNG